jgi:hypothetical protein
VPLVVPQVAAGKRSAHIEGPLVAADRHLADIAAVDKRDTVILTVDMVMMGDIVTSRRLLTEF